MMQDGMVLGGLLLIGLLLVMVYYPGQGLVAAGILMIAGGLIASAASRTVFQEIAGTLGLVGGLIAFGLGLVVVQLVAIRKSLEGRPAPPPAPTPAVGPAARAERSDPAVEAWSRRQEERWPR